MTGDTALTELKNCRRFKSVMLVGHEPDFSGLVRHLLGFGASATVRIRKASLTELELPTLRAGMATLHFSIPCKLMT
jgi:phosphohistidine phosphatase